MKVPYLLPLLLACLAAASCSRPAATPAAAGTPPTPWEQAPAPGLTLAQSDSVYAAYRF